MHGLIVQLKSTAGNRDRLIDILLRGTEVMPGCRLHAVAADTTDDSVVWITEIWDSEELHRAALTLPSVRAAIEEAKPLISAFGDRHVVTPIGGIGVNTKTDR